MTSPVAVIGLVYDTTDLQPSDLSFFFEIIRGLNEPPSVRGRDTIVPARTGRIARNRRADVWTIELRGWVRGLGATPGDDREDFRAHADIIRALFDPTRMPATLTATLETGEVRTIVARPLPTQVWSQVVPEFHNVNIELEAYSDWEPEGS